MQSGLVEDRLVIRHGDGHRHVGNSSAGRPRRVAVIITAFLCLSLLSPMFGVLPARPGIRRRMHCRPRRCPSLVAGCPHTPHLGVIARRTAPMMATTQRIGAQTGCPPGWPTTSPASQWHSGVT